MKERKERKQQSKQFNKIGLWYGIVLIILINYW